MVAAAIYFLTKMKKIDILASIRKRKFSKGGRRGWYGWRKKNPDNHTDLPPNYSSEDYNSGEKAVPNEQQVDNFYAPAAVPVVAIAANVPTLSPPSPQRQDAGREALLTNSAPFGTSLAPQAQDLSATRNFYNIGPQNPSVSQEQLNTYVGPGTQNFLVSSQLSDYNNTGS